MSRRKPFPARMCWTELWGHRWTLLNMLNQIAHGTREDAAIVARHYSGDETFGLALYYAAQCVIETEERRR